MDQTCQSPPLSLYECIGKGGSGCVYRGIDEESGAIYAVKQIDLVNIPENELEHIMMEIDLLKELKHPNIVKYEGFFQTKKSLNVVMEYCESGSLIKVRRRIGKLPENLAATYMNQVLKGLIYLHEQGVIHRDLKCANILMTKNDQVKLADFGVATRLSEPSISSLVAGSPYWMAPEVIELNGATTASDIWSLGCTLIELIQGNPPYHRLAPMSAMFRIVQDDYPPLPDNISPLCRNFLEQCFQKDPNLRINATKLIKHPWILQNCSAQNAYAIKTSNDMRVLEKDSKGTKKPIKKSTAYNPNCNNRHDWSELTEPDNWEKDFESFVSLTLDVANRPPFYSEPHDEFAKVDHEDIWDNDFELPCELNSFISHANELQNQIPIKEMQQIDIQEQIDALACFSEEKDLIGDDWSHLFEVSDMDTIETHSAIAATEISHDDPFEDIELEEWVDEGEHLKITNTVSTYIHMLKSAQQGNVKDTLELLVSLVRRSTQIHKKYNILRAHPDVTRRTWTHHHLLVLMDMLTIFKKEDEVCHVVLRIINMVIHKNPKLQENVCLLGAIPIILSFFSTEKDLRIICEVSILIQHFCSNNLTRQLLMSCGGLRILALLLERTYFADLKIIENAVSSLLNVFESQNVAKNDICWILEKEGFITKTVNLLHHAVALKNICLLENTSRLLLHLSLADNSIKERLAENSCIKVITTNVSIIKLWMSEKNNVILVNILKCLKNISTLPYSHDALVSVNIIPILCSIISSSQSWEIKNQVISIIFNVCRLNAERQTMAARCGIIPHLQSFIKSNNPLKQFAIQLICEMAQSGITCRSFLWNENVAETYFYLLNDLYWMANVLDALIAWTAAEPFKIENLLKQPQNSKLLVKSICKTPIGHLENILSPLQKLISFSGAICQNFMDRGFLKWLQSQLSHPKANVRVSILKIISKIQDHYNSSELRTFKIKNGSHAFLDLFDLRLGITRLIILDNSIIVKEMARKIINERQ